MGVEIMAGVLSPSFMFRLFHSLTTQARPAAGEYASQETPSSAVGLKGELNTVTTVHAPHSSSRQAILELLDPFMNYNPHELLAAVVVVWSMGSNETETLTRRQTLIEVLNSMRLSSPDHVIGALVDVFVWMCPRKPCQKLDGLHFAQGIMLFALT